MAAIWVGTETGILKGIDSNKKTFENYGDLSSLSKQDEICQMCWLEDGGENQIFIAVKSGIVKTFDVVKQDYIHEQKCFVPEDGPITGLERQDGTLLACCQNGILRLFKDSDDEPTDIKVGNNIARMRQNPSQPFQVATGGDENSLKLWDLNKPNEPIFKAKNVRNDQLDLQVPIFVKDMAFLSSPGSLPKIVVGTAYHKIQLYDLKAQKRPVMDISFRESPITCVSLPHHQKSVVVGNTYGDMADIDLRNAGKELGSYKSFSGSINDIMCHNSEPFVASCGMDRFLRIHQVDTRQLVDKIYLKSRLKCLLFSKDFKKETDKKQKDFKTKRKLDGNENENCESSDEEEIWNTMDVVEDEKSNHKSKKQRKKKGQPKDISKENESQKGSNNGKEDHY